MMRQKRPLKHNSHPRCHWTKKKGLWKVKKSYKTESEAQEFIDNHNLFKSNYYAYQCQICGFWHIGYKKIQK